MIILRGKLSTEKMAVKFRVKMFLEGKSEKGVNKRVRDVEQYLGQRPK